MGKLRNVFNILLGLVAVIFLFLFKLFFLVTAIISLYTVGYSFINYIVGISSGADVELAVYSFTVSLNAVYLYITVKLGVGMYDILLWVQRISSLFRHKKSDATSGGSNTVLGSKGVFKR